MIAMRFQASDTFDVTSILHHNFYQYVTSLENGIWRSTHFRRLLEFTHLIRAVAAYITDIQCPHPSDSIGFTRKWTHWARVNPTGCDVLLVRLVFVPSSASRRKSRLARYDVTQVVVDR